MYIKSHIQILYWLWDHNVQSWRKSFFPLLHIGFEVFREPKKTNFKSFFELHLFNTLFQSELGLPLYNFYPYRTYKTYRNAWFFAWRYAEIQIQRLVFDNKKACEELLDWESKRWDHALVPLLHAQKTKLEKK